MGESFLSKETSSKDYTSLYIVSKKKKKKK